jgi:AraC-like DNA-binding protein
MVQQYNVNIRTIAENIGYNSPYYLEKKYAEFLKQLGQDGSP